MATALSPVDARVVVRCDLCLLVQFPAASKACRRCHASLDPAPEPCALPTPAPARHVSQLVAATAKRLRLDRGLSQRDLGALMRVPRTYVSKVENEKATPTFASLQRFAEALEVTVAELVADEKGRQDEIAELLKDQFISQLLPYVSKLNRAQKATLLGQMHDRASRARAAAA